MTVALSSLYCPASGLWEAPGLFRVGAVDALKEWHDFYVLVGTAGATLLALPFVAASLGAGFLTDERQPATDTFMSLVVVHFTTVFFPSAAALCPWHQARFLAALIGVTALVGAILSTTITVRVVRTDMTNHLEDYPPYGLLPGLGYLALLAPPCRSICKRILGWIRWQGLCCCWRSSTSATPGTSRSPWSVAGPAEGTSLAGDSALNPRA